MAAFQLLATMYIKYIQIFRRLEQCYDQIVHPQKRRVLRHVLDGTMGRILELKNEMVNLEFSEFHYFDDVLSDLKLTPVRIGHDLFNRTVLIVLWHGAQKLSELLFFNANPGSFLSTLVISCAHFTCIFLYEDNQFLHLSAE